MQPIDSSQVNEQPKKTPEEDAPHLHNKEEPSAEPTSPSPQWSFHYLRGFVILLVVLHHAVLAYTTFVTFNPKNPITNISPVVDSQRWSGFNYIVAFNDLFFMHLLFFVSGLFVWGSLQRKGIQAFLRTRLTRLGVPFVLGVLTLIPLAFYPTMLQLGRMQNKTFAFGDYWLGLAQRGFPTPGTLWFIWLLLVFNLLAVAWFSFKPNMGQTKEPSAVTRALPLFVRLFGCAFVAHLAMLIVVHEYAWIGVGPFVVQGSRILLYLVYFLAGVIVGAHGLQRSYFAANSSLSKRWWAWLGVCLLAFLPLALLPPKVFKGQLHGLVLVTLIGVTALFGFIGLFHRLTTGRVRWMDSLSQHSYGIYFVHYTYITWLQYALLDVSLHPAAKGLLVFSGTLALSWSTVALLRRIPIVARII
ncbi:MAG: acyltransferase [Deltaproteobacteria bacterium]|nr:MAG: acyltransferase [Deltaproteobacteria bacterium]